MRLLPGIGISIIYVVVFLQVSGRIALKRLSRQFTGDFLTTVHPPLWWWLLLLLPPCAFIVWSYLRVR